MANSTPYFSILIPTWNSLPYLQNCLRSIELNSSYPHEIILHVNDGSDRTLDWVSQQDIKYTHSANNIGICTALNQAFQQSSSKYICYLNDDMYVLPGWDTALMQEVNKVEDNNLYMFSSTMIEPRDSGNSCVIVGDFGDSLESFKEQELLQAKTQKQDWSGSSWPPFVVSRKSWEIVGGFSEEFSPGYYSDPDLSMKLWEAGCRIFMGVGKSQVYHFMQKSTGKVVKNNGRIQFMKKWGLPASAFYKHYLKMGKKYEGALVEPSRSLLLEKAKAKLLPLFTK